MTLTPLARLCASPRAPLVAVALAFLLALPTLGVGLILDDWMHILDLDPYWQSPDGVRGPWDLYHFVTEAPAHRRFELDHGWLPWWTAPALRLAFLRPLASLSLAFDFTYLLGHRWVMHLENALWHAALAAAAWGVYRRAFTAPRVAALAAILFAVDHTHAMLVVWLSNRHALMSAVFALASFGVHLRWRQERRGLGAVAAPALYALSLACGETGLSLLAYLLPFTLWNDRATAASRLRALAPYALLSLAWAALYRQQGCGAYGGDLYVDPVRQPLTFLHAFVARAPVLCLAQTFAPPAEFVPPAGAAVGLAVAALLALALRPLVALVRGDPMARTWAAGALLSLVPACATMPNDRLLVCAGLGAMGLLAPGARRRVVVGRPCHPRRPLRARGARGRPPRALSAPPPCARAPDRRDQPGYVDRADRSLPADAAVRDHLVVAVTAPDPLTTPYAFGRRMVEGRPAPRRGARLLVTPSAGVTTLRREGARARWSCRRRPRCPPTSSARDRGLEQPFRDGDVVETDGCAPRCSSALPTGARAPSASPSNATSTTPRCGGSTGRTGASSASPSHRRAPR